MESTSGTSDREIESCASCGAQLKPSDQNELNGLIYCEDCYTEQEEMEDLFLLEDQF